MLILALITISTTTAAALSCDYGDICVDQSGWWRDGGTFTASGTPIQAAVDNANAGETICVAAGSYTENVVITKRLTLAGEGADLTIVDGNTGDACFEVDWTDRVNITGFTATNAGYGAAIYLNHANHCNISGNNVSYNDDYGIRVYYSSYNTLTGNTVGQNGDHGIHIYYGDNNTVTENIMENNTNEYSSGVYLIHGDYNVISDNTASYNYYGIGLYASTGNVVTGNNVGGNSMYGFRMYDADDNAITYNWVTENGDMGFHMTGGTSGSTGNNISCNLVQNNTDCGIYLTSRSTGNTIAGNNIVSNGELQTDGSYQYQFKNSQSDGVDAINNFWGAGMNNSTIDASIYDDEEGQAEVNFYPFETRPVPCAPAPISEESPAFTTVDAVIALEMAVGSCPTDLHWDVSGDGQVTSLDALMIAMDARTG